MNTDTTTNEKPHWIADRKYDSAWHIYDLEELHKHLRANDYPEDFDDWDRIDEAQRRLRKVKVNIREVKTFCAKHGIAMVKDICADAWEIQPDTEDKATLFKLRWF